MRGISATQQRNAVSEGIALGLLMCDCNEIPYDKFRVDLAFEHVGCQVNGTTSELVLP
ncbi:hypothetical protein MycrhDRAFT_1151 [Mycobacterium terramassiliense]|uniref:Uncharacterized protein n=1 Tax=Mycobacterium terramassiliense TaxID=1841859 RepID=A0A2U3N6S9_9MYCO|nr:hypothetical protein MycrhDRAFT_1151 [Mycobacterium terramassiliense]